MNNVSRQLLSHAETIFSALGRTIGYIGIGILVVMMLLTVADVFMRYVFNQPIQGTTEITQFMMVSLAFLTLVWTTMRRVHIRVDLISQHISLKARLISDSFYFLLTCGAYFFICRQTFLEAGAIRRVGEISEILDIPVYPFYLVVAVASGIVVLILMIHTVQGIVQAVKQWK